MPEGEFGAHNNAKKGRRGARGGIRAQNKAKKGGRGCRVGSFGHKIKQQRKEGGAGGGVWDM